LAASKKSSLQEFELIARLCAKLPHGRRTLIGAGDDCALLAPSQFRQVVTIDSIVEGVHFKLEWTTPELLGARALTVNLSDVAAMGSVPTTCVVNLAVRPGLDYRFFDRLYAGLRQAALDSRVDVVGGNITRAAELSITIALMGEVRDGVMRRDAARPGDSIFVTGTLGDAAAGLRILRGDLNARGANREFLISRYRAPTARLIAGRRMARRRPVPAAIDISDGFCQDLGHVLAASGVGADVTVEGIPRSSAYQSVVGDDPKLALSGGDDYELLFCTAEIPAAASGRKLGVPVARVGEIVTRRGLRLYSKGRVIAAIPARNTSRTPATRRPPSFSMGGWDQLQDGRN
jgi:thiamine-monophosphate kinase